MNTLHKIGEEERTDKHDSQHSFAGKSYLHIYEEYLRDLRGRSINFLELGVKKGASHRMWAKYFREGSKIYGVDIDPNAKKFQRKDIKIFIGGQDSLEVRNNIIEDCGMLDVILDDASHVNELTLRSFELYFPFVKPGGLYIIEDLGTSYEEDNLKNSIKKGRWPGMHLVKNVELVNHRVDMDKFFLNLIKELDKEEALHEWVHFYSKIAIIKKREDV